MDLSRSKVPNKERTAMLASGAITVFILLGTYNNIFSFFAFFLIIGALFVLSEENYLSLLMFIMPYATIFKVAPSAQSLFTYVVLFYVLYNMVAKHWTNLGLLVAFALFVAYLVIQMCVSFNILRIIKLLANILLVYYATRINIKNDGKQVFLSYVLGLLTSSLVMASNFFPHLIAYIGENKLGGLDGNLRFTGMYGDPNYFSVNIIISLCLLVVLSHQKLIKGALATVLSILLVVFSLMTYSKSAFIMLLVPAIMLLYSKVKSRKYFIFLSLTVIGSVFLLNMFAGRIDFLATILERFSDVEDMNSLTTGRFGLWSNYANLFLNSGTTILGWGLGAELLNGMAPHNTYIDMIYYLGIFGSILFLITLAFAMKKENNTRFKKSLLNYSVLLSIFVMYFFLSELFYFDWPFHIIICSLVLNINFSDVLEKRDESVK